MVFVVHCPQLSAFTPLSFFPLAAVKENPRLRRATSMSHSKRGDGNGRVEMEQFYKGHRIEFSVWLEHDGWIASLYIYSETQNTLVTFALPDTFNTYGEAMEAGLAAAKKWIDEKSEH
jgi:hypothetical protein